MLALLAATLPAIAQSPAGGKPVAGNFDGLKATDLILKLPHIHWSPVKCKSAPDGVYGKSGRTYYGCMKGKDVCSDEKGVIPKSMMAAFDATMAAHDARMTEFRAGVRQTMTGAGQQRPSRTARTARSPRAAATIPQADPAPPATPITEEQLNEVAAGTAKPEVLGKLGDPYMRISGDSERFTYLLTSGKLGKIDLENGKVTRTRIVAAE